MERSEEATLVGKLSSLVGQKNSHIIRDKNNWALLASLAHDKYVVVEGLDHTCLGAAEKEGLHLVGVGSTTREVWKAFWPWAQYHVETVARIMTAKECLAPSAVRCGLEIYEQVGREYRLILPSATSILKFWELLDVLELKHVLELKPRSVVSPPLIQLNNAVYFGAHASGNASTPINCWVQDFRPAATPYEIVQTSKAALQQAFSHWPPANLTRTVHHHQVTNGHSLSRGTNNDVRTTADYDLPLVVGAAPGQNTWGIIHGRMSGNVPEASDHIVYSDFSTHNYGTGAGGHSLRSSGGRLTVDLSELDLEVGGQPLSITRNDGARARLTNRGQTWDFAKELEGVMGQGFFVCLPLCLTAYSQLKDAPDYVQFVTFGGLASITAGFATGMLCKSMARRRLTIRLVSSSAITVLAFSIASQLSGATYKALTALVATALNFLIMLLQF